MKHRLLIAVVSAVILTRASVAQQIPRNTPPPPPKINIGTQLMITDLRVVEDPVRTNPLNGPRATWTFKYLMENMAGNQDPSEFAMRWLQQWERNQVVNGSVSRARPGIRQLVIDPWLKASGGRKLNLTKAPFKLLAIVNRMDLSVHVGTSVWNAGEGRFVFGVLGADGKPLPPIAGPVPGGFTVIFEYGLNATQMSQLRDWAMQWAQLGSSPLGSPAYNQALENLTRRFTDKGSAPAKPNGSSLNQIRTDDIALDIPWELREFVIDPTTHQLAQHTVALTPDILSLNGTPALAALINSNEASLLDGSYSLPPALFGASTFAGPFQLSDFTNPSNRTFMATVLFEPFYDIPWSAAGIRNNDARHGFALNTCGGCHRTETGTGFLQVGFPSTNNLPRSLGRPAELAGFLTGIEVADPVDPTTTRSFNDLERRRQDLEELLASFGPNGAGPGPRGQHIPNFVH